ncbi:MAG: M15 family metallopeptidase, partial [Bifidobacteriaceae bacterium]|nr:M15 family metallopeptidase [Bifidobacteriaceae bacterium]
MSRKETLAQIKGGGGHTVALRRARLMRARRIALLIGVIALIALGFLVYNLFFQKHSETPLDSVQIKSVAESESADVDLLVLVNKNNKLPDDYRVDLTALGEQKVASVLLNDLKDMRDAAASDGVSLYITSAYRSTAEQEQVFRETVDDYVSQGYSAEIAEDLAARPGYSEHETGLAIDFSLDGNAQKQAEMWNWLSLNAHNFGFILRYPENARHITGYRAEAWHYRYVGKEHAKAIYEQGVTLEEYLGKVVEFEVPMDLSP